MATDTYAYQKLKSMNLSKEFWSAVIKYLQKYQKDMGIKTMTEAGIKSAIATMPIELRTQYPKDYSWLIKYYDIKGIEDTYGRNKAEMIDDVTDPEILKKRFDEVYQKVKDNPAFKKYRDSEFWQLKKEQEYEVQDYERIAEYAKDDYIKTLAKTDAYLADSLQKATEQYWMRGVLGSTVQKDQSQQVIRQWIDTKDWYGTELDRLLEKTSIGIKRSKEAYDYNKTKLEWQQEKESNLLALDDFNRQNQTRLDQLTRLL